MENKQEELKSAEELMNYEESRKYLISEGLNPDQIAKEGLVFIKTVKENIELKKQLEKKDKLNKGLAQTGNFYRNQLKEKEEELNDWKKNVKDYNDRIIDEEIAGKLLKLIPSDEDIEKLGEKWLGGKFNYATYDAHLTGFIEGQKQLRSKLLTEYQNSKK